MWIMDTESDHDRKKVSIIWDYKHVQTPDGRWLRSMEKCPMLISNEGLLSPVRNPSFCGRVCFRHPKGHLVTIENKYPMYHISGAEYRDDRGVKFFDQDSVRTSTGENEKTNKQNQQRHRKNNNKYNTTCIRCGLISHRSTLCPTYPRSETQCDICKRFHQTSKHRDAGNLENPLYLCTNTI